VVGKKNLTDRYLKSLRPAPAGKREVVWDTRVPGFGVLVSDVEDSDPARHGKAGKVTFIVYARFRRGASPTRRPIGIYGVISLEEARRTAGEWRSQVEKGIDPAIVEAERSKAAAREAALRRKHSFANVADTFIADKLSAERQARKVERILRTIFVAGWVDRPISEISKHDVLEIINAKKRKAPQMARAHLILAKRFFNWVIDQHVSVVMMGPVLLPQ
jgi:hypothetical protein